MSYSSYDREATIRIYESYIYCKDRKDIELERSVYKDVSLTDAAARLKAVEEELGDRCKPIYEIEDMIHDFQLVDREWLELAKFVRSGQIAKMEEV